MYILVQTVHKNFDQTFQPVTMFALSYSLTTAKFSKIKNAHHYYIQFFSDVVRAYTLLNLAFTRD